MQCHWLAVPNIAIAAAKKNPKDINQKALKKKTNEPK